MAKSHSKRNPGINPPRPGAMQNGETAEDLTQLCNRIALLTFAASFGFVVALVALAAALAADGAGLGWVAASLPLLAAVAAVLRVRQLRAELHTKRERRAPAAPVVPSDLPGTSRA